MSKRPKHKLPPKDAAIIRQAESLARQRMKQNPPPAEPPTRRDIEAELRARAAEIEAAGFSRNQPAA